jgi:hypothetical protein
MRTPARAQNNKQISSLTQQPCIVLAFAGRLPSTFVSAGAPCTVTGVVRVWMWVWVL